MNEHDQLREQMWDLVYDLAGPEEKAALCARIKSDPKAARLYAEVSLEADLIGQAAKVDDVSVTLPQVAPRREKVAAGRAKESVAPLARGTGPARWLHAAVAATALGLGGVLAVGTFWREQMPLAQIPDRIDVYATEPLIEGVPERKLMVEAKDADGNPASDEFQAWFVSQDGRVLDLQRVKTDETGRADLVIKGDALKRDTLLRVSRFAEQSAEPAEQVAQVAKQEELLLDGLLDVQPEPFRTQATFDKEVYEPQDVVRFRVVANSAFTHQPQDAKALYYRLIGPDNQQLAPADSMSLEGTGVVTGEFQLPSDAAAGKYAFVVTNPAAGQEQVEANVMVGRDVTQLQQDLLSYHGLSAASRAASFGGGGLGPGPGGGGGPLPSENREEKHDRTARSAVRKKMDKRDALDTAGKLAQSAPAPAPAEAPAPAAPAGTAGPESLVQLNNARKSEAERLAEADQKKLHATEQADDYSRSQAKTLAVAVPPGLAGKPLTIEVRYQDTLLGKQVVSPPADSAHQALSEKVVDSRDPVTVGVPLAPWIDGEVDVRYYLNSATPPQLLMAQRVLTPSQFDIVLKDAKEAYAPGDKVQFVVEVTDRVEQVASGLNLGLSVRPVLSDELEVAQQLDKAVKQQVRAQGTQESDGKDNPRDEVDANADQRGGARRRKGESDEAKTAEESAKKTDADAPRASAPATASATPPPAPAAGDALPTLAAGRSNTEGEPAVNGAEIALDGSQPLEYESGFMPAPPSTEFQPQVVVSNKVQVDRALQQQQEDRAARKAQLALWRGRLGKLLLLGGVAMLVVLGIAVAVHRPAKARIWLIPLGIAAASFAVGIVWLVKQPKKPGAEVARHEAAEAAGVAEDFDRVRPMVPSAPELPLVMMDNESADAPAAAPGAFAPSQAPGLGGQPAERFADGAETRTPAEPGGDLRQRSSTAPRGGPAQPDDVERLRLLRDKTHEDGANAPPDRSSGKSSGTPSGPGTAAKGAMPPRESDKELPGASDRGTKKARKPRPEAIAKEKLADTTEALELEKKRTLELFMKAEGAGREVAEVRKDELAEATRLKDVKKQANTTIWQPLLKTDENGRAVIEFTMPQAPGDYRLVLDVHGPGRVGRVEQLIRCQAPPAARAAEPAAEAKP